MKGSFPIVILFSILLLFSCNRNEKKTEATAEATKYTCPMHPQIVKDAPGSCPICGMDLVPMQSNHAHETANDSLAALVKPTNEIILADIKTVRPQTGSRFDESAVKGVINYNTNNQNTVSSRVSGRVERLYIKYNYQPVSKGQKLMDIYSPDLANAQQELLFLKNAGESALLESAKKKLRLLGATDQQISQVLKTGKVDYTISIYSPYSGYISEAQSASSQASAPSAVGSTTITSEASGGSSSMGGMGGSGSTPSAMPASTPNVASNSPLLLREGQYVSVGQKLFGLVSANTVWAEFYARPDQLEKFKRGIMVQVHSIDNASKRTRVPVTLIQPYYNEGSNYSIVRASIPNGNKQWKVGELVNVGSENTRKIGNWLPRKAVLQLGTKYVVFVKDGNSFKPAYVSVKAISGDWVDIGNSINKNQEVAENAWFLVDSESFITVQEPQK